MNPFSVVIESAQALGRALLTQLPLLLLAVVVFVLFVLAAKVVRGLVRRAMRRHDPSLAQMGSGIVYGGMLLIGSLLSLWVAVPTFNFPEVVASLGLGGLILGFALKDLLENFVAGILILWRRPFRVGDQVRSGQFEGTVEEINFRSTLLRTYDGVRVYIPNGVVFTEPVENFTAHLNRRSTVVLGIDQRASVPRAREVILAALRATDGVLPEPAPMVLFDSVGDFANMLHVHYWTCPPTRLSEVTTRSDVTERLYSDLLAAGIGFPYPIQTVQLGETRAIGADA